LEFERVQQAKLQEDIAKIRALIAEAEGPSDSSESALEGWIESLKVHYVKLRVMWGFPFVSIGTKLDNIGYVEFLTGPFGAVW
jgi:hypothetical protein